MISDQCTYTYLHNNTPFYAFISHILTFAEFPDRGVASLSNRRTNNKRGGEITWEPMCHLVTGRSQLGLTKTFS